MKPEEIIYWNQYSGLTEFCRRSEMIYSKKMEIFNQTCETKKVVEGIFSDGSFTFEIRDKDLRIFADPFMKALYASGKPMMADFTIIMSCTFKIVEQTEDFVDFQLTEIVNNSAPVTIGYIKIHRHITEPINGYNCKGAIIIHDVQMGKGSQLTLSALGVFAMGVGLYLLSYMNDWKSIGNILNRHLVTPESKIKELNEKLSVGNAKIFELQEILETERNENANKISSLQNIIREQNAQIAALNEQIQKLNAVIAQNIPAELAPQVTDDRDYIAEFKNKLHGQKLCLVGGNKTLLKKFSKGFPNTTFINKESFDEQKLKSSSVLIINTNFIGHSCTKKAVEIATISEIPIHYTSKNNLKSIAKDLIDKINFDGE